MLRILISLVLSISFFQSNAQTFTSSNLPILIIDSGNNEIVGDPKVDASLKIIYQPDGSRNQINDTNFHFDGEIGIELRGQSSLALFPKKSFGIEIRDEAGEDLNVSILDMPEESDWVIHSPYSDKSLIRNALSYHLAAQIMDYAPRIRLCELIINGQYYGVVLLTEKIKRDKNRVNLSKLNADEISGDDLTGGYIIRFDKGNEDEIGWISPFKPLEGVEQETRFLYHYPKAEDIVQEQEDYIRGFITEFEQVLASSDFKDPSSGYRKYIDPASFIDFILITEMTRNIDGYRLSTYMSKDKDSKGGLLKMGPVWDFNLALGNANYCNGSDIAGWEWDFNEYCPEDFWLNHFWWKRLLSDPEFSLELTDRWNTLRQGMFSNNQLLATVDSMTNLLSEAQGRNFQLWPILGEWIWPNANVGGSYNNEVTYLKNWLIQRVEWMDGNINKVTPNRNPTLLTTSIRVYPNPATEQVVFDLSGSDIKDGLIEVYDAYGRRVYQSDRTTGTTEITWNPSSPPGIYYYVFRSSKGTAGGSLILE